jgi:hypothetical protein
MRCAANNYHRKSYKKHKWTEAYTKGIYSIQYWRLQRKIREHADSNNASSQTLQFYAAKSGMQSLSDKMQHMAASCLEGITSARSGIKHEILVQSNAKEQYQYDLTSDIIDRKSPYIANSVYISVKLQRDDLIDRKLKHMYCRFHNEKIELLPSHVM